jgi:hypothetical protein
MTPDDRAGRAQKVISQDPYLGLAAGRPWSVRGTWPSRWISLVDPPSAPFLAAYRLGFTLDAATTLRIHVSADERYDLLCDGVRLGRGPERGDAAHWFFETYDLTLAAGEHCLVAKVWSLGEQAPYAQMSVCHGFILGAEGDFLSRLGTGLALWEGKRVGGCDFLPAGMTWGAGATLKVDGAAYPWGIEMGKGDGWAPVAVLHQGVNGAIKNEWPARHRLWPATLPPQLDAEVGGLTVRHIDDTPLAVTESTPVLASRSLTEEGAAWQQLLDARVPLVLPARVCRRVILDFGAYQCAYPELTVSGGAGARIRVHWAEGLYEGTSGKLSEGGAADARGKGNRDVVENKCFIGAGNLFLPDGGVERRFESLWWAAGRYVEVAIETGEAPLTLVGWRFRESRYPLTMEGKLEASDPRWQGMTGLAVRTLQMCAHETYMDCPYYEQLQYLGDTRLQVLATFVLTPDDRLPRKALQMGLASILGDRGLTQSRYPSRVAQVIPPFSLWWVAMLHDFALWRGDLPFVRSLMPSARLVLDTFLALLDAEGLMRSPEGWNLMDWVPAWTETTRDVRNWGVPPDGETGISGLLNWHLVYTLTRAAELERWLGEPEQAARWRRRAVTLSKRLDAAFWDAPRGLYADDLAHRHYSEHAQCLALLSGTLPRRQTRALSESLFRERDIERGTIYFTHYLFECAAAARQVQPLFARMETLWFPLAGMGFKALPEEPEPCRSDCHAWGAHPLYHFYTTVLGIRPAAPGGSQLTIAPQLGPLQQASGTLPHPRGEVTVELEAGGGGLHGRILLPGGVTATLQVNGHRHALTAGVFDW